MNTKNKNIFTSANIMIPKSGIDMSKWSVVACDQYTSERNYWEDIKNDIADAPSTLHMVFPEIYLEDEGFDARINSISDSMKKYLADDIFDTYENAFVYVKRTLANKKIRHGIMGKIDLEYYDYQKGSTLPVRATEGTVLERIPPRVKVRQNCPLETPHIMVLIDDEEKKIIENIAAQAGDLPKIYDFTLMKDSGHLDGYLLNADCQEILNHGIQKLIEQQADQDSPLLFAVGDGNHSLATAKKCYENLKLEIGDKALESNARYALIELVNLHDDSLEFEAIHRVLFGVDKEHFLTELNQVFSATSCENTTLAHHDFTLVTQDNEIVYDILNPACNLAVGDVQNFIDAYLAEHDGTVDYIHGEDVVKTLCQEDNTIGILLNCMDKKDLYKTVIVDGALPRKTFSMGEACDKRFYLEVRNVAK